MPKIVLDTNALPRQGKLYNVIMSAVLRIAKHLGMEVCLPDIVVEESVNARRRAAESAVEQLSTAVNQASKLFDLDPIYIPSAGDAAQYWREELERNFTILETDPADAKEALFREANRIPPARQGRGARDSAIWLIIKRHQQSYAEPVYFVSNNTDDFADTATSGLHSKLQKELGADDGPVEYCKTLDSLLDRLAARVTRPVGNSDVELMVDELLGGILTTGALSEFGSTEELANAELEISSVNAIRAYSVDGTTLALCEVVATAQVPSESDKDEVLAAKRAYIHLRCWLEIDETTSTPSALDVIDVDNVKSIDDE